MKSRSEQEESAEVIEIDKSKLFWCNKFGFKVGYRFTQSSFEAL